MVLGMLSGRTRGELAPRVPTVVLALDTEQKRSLKGIRFQERTLRSAGVGELTFRYQTGKDKDGLQHGADSLAAIAPKGAKFTYETVEEVLRLRCLGLRQREEIRSALAEKGVRISTGSVSNLTREGLSGLELLQRKGAGTLAEEYRKKAFILHLDGTREGGKWAHFVLREEKNHARGLIALIDRITSYGGDLKAEGFPFDLPHLHFQKRCRETGAALLEMLHTGVNRYGCKDPVIGCLRDLREVLRRQVEFLPNNPEKRIEKLPHFPKECNYVGSVSSKTSMILRWTGLVSV